MPRAKTSYKTKPKYKGNQFQTKDHRPRPKPDDQPTNASPQPKPSPSLSSKKLASSSTKYDTYQSSGYGNIIFDVGLLSSLVKSFVRCKFCDGDDCVELCVVDSGKLFRQGLAVNLELKCSLCLESITFCNSTFNKENEKYDINIMFVYAMRTIGRGLAPANVFCSLMNLPSPPQKFEPYTKLLLKAVKKCANESMVKATKEAVAENCEETKTDLSVCLDGSWQRRGHKSLNGYVSVTSFDTGKVLDVAIMSKYCQVCTIAVNKTKIPTHTCTQNYSGSSGSMEVAGALQVFQNSLDRNVHYVKYLGDGDSNGFLKVLESKPYGDEKTIQKLECVNHVKNGWVRG